MTTLARTTCLYLVLCSPRNYKPNKNVVLAMTDWTPHEVHETVSAYLKMLTLELSGQNYNKAAVNRVLIEKLGDRSKAAIEFKHCNISAALMELGFPVVQGYKPRRNFQRQALFDTLHRSENHSILS